MAGSLDEEQKKEVARLYREEKCSVKELKEKYNVSDKTIYRAINDPTGEKTRQINQQSRQRTKQQAAQRMRENYKSYALHLNLKTDIDVIMFLENKDNCRNYILSLIRDDMRNHPIEVKESQEQYKISLTEKRNED